MRALDAPLLPRWGVVGLGVLLALAVAPPLAAQSVTIAERPSSELELFCTYRSASGAVVSNRDVTWRTDRDDLIQVVPAPSGGRMRYVYVRPRGQAGTAGLWCSATVSGVTYQDSLAVVVLPVTAWAVHRSGWPVAEPAPAPPPPPVAVVGAVELCPAAARVAAGETVQFCPRVVFASGNVAMPAWLRLVPACDAYRPGGAASAAEQAVADGVTFGASLGTITSTGLWTAVRPAGSDTTQDQAGVVWAEVAGVRSRPGSCP